MDKTLMILTRDRRDLVDLSLRLHQRAGSFDFFDRVVFLLNDVSEAHMAFVDGWIARNPDVVWDKIEGDGTRPQGISAMQNQCIEKYPGGFYAKTDEDVFVPRGWPERMWEAYQAHADRDDLALITPLVPNNAYGLHALLTEHYPELLAEYRERFGGDPSPEVQGPTWQRPDIGAWATRQFLHLEAANHRHREVLAASGKPDFTLFSKYFSIGCIGYDDRHIERMGGVPWNDEPGWCTWIEDHNQTCVLDHRQVVLHYTFFVQQEWLDRSSLIEDLYRANLDLRRPPLARAARILKQVPGILRRRLGKG